jgi:hypothetical protein
MNQKIKIGWIIVLVFTIIGSHAQTTTVGNALKADTLSKIADTIPPSGVGGLDTIPPVIVGSWYAEAGGNALFYSVNYEKVLKTAKKYKLALRGGFGYVPSVGGEVYFPLEFNYLRGKENYFLELGIGLTPSYADWKEVGFEGTLEKTFHAITSLRLGFRLITEDRRWLLRAGILMLWRSVFINEHQQRIFFYENRDYYSKTTIWDGIGQSIKPWFGVSVGYNLFK